MSIDIERLKHDLDYWNSVAPEGATHYAQGEGCLVPGWYKPSIDADGEHLFCAKHRPNWIRAEKFGRRTKLIPRPSPAWDGSGLPPVGVECEFRAKGGSLNNGIDIDWTRCKVIAVTCKYAILCHLKDGVAAGHECPHSLDRIEFRPLKTEKERVVEAALNALDSTIGSAKDDKKVCEALYDAGLLKMPEGDQ